ncbi:zinc-dependent alcohol dehydrogenase [Kitasatospora mediocidica]|uniref:zinc-dependent alcohol dehydrogenase n=1 Tax=Kitasatospora mediocidica TaxID=58352 RepID=UPI00068F0F19|nr:zinc-binding dehydrogenase [Kitasatospora mediocidica]
MYTYEMARPGSLRIKESAVPSCGADEALLQTEAVSICSTDVSYHRGHLSSSVWPLTPGHEYVGRVVEVGSRLNSRVHVGDRMSYWGQTDFGGMAEYRAIRPILPGHTEETGWFTDRGFMDADQAAAIIIPPDLPSELATAVEPLTSVLRSLLLNPPRPGDRCAVLGAGPSAILALQVLRKVMGAEVMVLDRNTDRLLVAARYGAARVFDPIGQADELVEMAAREHGQVVDYVFDALPCIESGNGPDVRELAMGLLRPAGTYVVYGASAIPQRINTWSILAKGLTLRATPFDVSSFPMARSARVLEIALHYMTSGLVDVSPVFSEAIDLQDEAAVIRAFEQYGAASSMKTSMLAGDARRALVPSTPAADQAGSPVRERVLAPLGAVGHHRLSDGVLNPAG